MKVLRKIKVFLLSELGIFLILELTKVILDFIGEIYFQDMDSEVRRLIKESILLFLEVSLNYLKEK